MLPDLNAKLLKQVLENLQFPEHLDEHPWIKSKFVLAKTTDDLELTEKSPGHRLVVSVSSLFMEMMPSTPPKRAKRLDTRWGKFGILAAQYFVPTWYGLKPPDSLREAWGGIDHAILLCRFGNKLDLISAEDTKLYQLVRDELDVAPLSTISDWHVKGIQQLARIIDAREHHLSRSPLSNEIRLATNEIDDNEAEGTLGLHNRSSDLGRKTGVSRASGWIWWLIIALLMVGFIFAGNWVWQLYQNAVVVRADLIQLQELASGPLTLEKIRTGSARLAIFRQDLSMLRAQASPVLRMLGPTLGWIPVYGTDIAESADLLEFADQLSGVILTGYQASGPFLEPDAVKYNPQLLTKLLLAAQPQLLQAKRQLDSALALRAGFRGEKFSPRIQSILDRFDPLLPQLDDAIKLGLSLPDIFGAGISGPKTYMLLVQNEDELRPTGGFITSVGSFVVKNGNVFGLQFQEAGDLEDWSLPYPDAPWQLARYMNSPVLVLRDANWFTDYPTAVSWIEFLYAYNHKSSVDGVIAINQQALVELLRTIGPVNLSGVVEPITAEDIIDYMRAAKAPPSPAPADFYRKAFISQIAAAIMQKVLTGDGIDWQKMTQMMVGTLNEHNILLQLDDPEMTVLLAKYGWDGVVRPESGDFFMTVDTNVGFNKTNAVVDRKISYDVDLTDPTNPNSTAVIFTTNRANNTASCIQWGDERSEKFYPIHYCYWNYLRVYAPTDSRLDSATPHAIPADWMALGESVPARVDTLEEIIPGVNGYGTMMVVPGGQTLDTSFKFLLPTNVVKFEPGTTLKSYSLKIQKQPGVNAAPLTIRVHLPARAEILQVPPLAEIDGQNILIETNLRTDVFIQVVFRAP